MPSTRFSNPLKFSPIFLLLLNLLWYSFACGAEKSNLQDKIIASTFKTLAKGFVLAVDIQKIKEKNITKLKKMDEDKFKEKYAKVYQTIKELPPDFKKSYGIAEQMTKEQAIDNIDSLDKKRMYKAIDEIPDGFIAGIFKEYLFQTKEKIQEVNLVEQIKKLWNKIVAKAQMK